VDSSQIYLSCVDQPLDSDETSPQCHQLDRHLKSDMSNTELPKFALTLLLIDCPISFNGNSPFQYHHWLFFFYILHLSANPVLCASKYLEQNFSPLKLWILGHTTIISCLGYCCNLPSWLSSVARDHSKKPLIFCLRDPYKASFRNNAWWWPARLCYLDFYHCDKMPENVNLKKERFILAHGFSPW
jgi:hypothetical protein